MLKIQRTTNKAVWIGGRVKYALKWLRQSLYICKVALERGAALERQQKRYIRLVFPYQQRVMLEYA